MKMGFVKEKLFKIQEKSEEFNRSKVGNNVVIRANGCNHFE
jgi:hypothetical protein